MLAAIIGFILAIFGVAAVLNGSVIWGLVLIVVGLGMAGSGPLARR